MPRPACAPRSARAFLQLASLPLGQTAPDAEAFVVPERVLKTLRPDLTALADPLRLSGRAALLGEERLRVGLRAQRALLPLLLFGVVEQVGKRAELPERSLPPVHDAI